MHKKKFTASGIILVFLLFLSAASPFIAGEQPLLYIHDGEWSMPFLQSENRSWNKLIITTDITEQDLIIQPIIPWSPGRSDFDNSNFVSPYAEQIITDDNGRVYPLPLRYRHLLGTTLRGADVLSGIIHGTRISLFAGCAAALLAAVIGFMTGAAGGSVAGKGIKVSTAGFLLVSICVLIIINALNIYRYGITTFPILFTVLLTSVISMWVLSRAFSNFSFYRASFTFPLDGFLMRINELFSTFPRLILILLFASFLKPSLLQVVLLLGFTGWTDLARIVRGEFIKVRHLNYTDAARLSGASQWRIYTRHLFPNILPTFSTAVFFTVAMNILLEAGLSFLGFGVPATIVTWGSLMAEGKDELNAWWMIIFPGIMLSLTVASLISISTRSQKGRGLI